MLPKRGPAEGEVQAVVVEVEVRVIRWFEVAASLRGVAVVMKGRPDAVAIPGLSSFGWRGEVGRTASMVLMRRRNSAKARTGMEDAGVGGGGSDGKPTVPLEEAKDADGDVVGGFFVVDGVFGEGLGDGVEIVGAAVVDKVDDGLRGEDVPEAIAGENEEFVVTRDIDGGDVGLRDDGTFKMSRLFVGRIPESPGHRKLAVDPAVRHEASCRADSSNFIRTVRPGII